MAHEDVQDVPQGMALTELALSVQLAEEHAGIAYQLARAISLDIDLAGLNNDNREEAPEVVEELDVVIQSLKSARLTISRTIHDVQTIIEQAEELQQPDKIDIYSEEVDPLVAEFVRKRVGQRITFDAIVNHLEQEGIVVPDEIDDGEELFAIWREEVASALDDEGFAESQGAVRGLWDRFAFDGPRKPKDWTYLLHLTGQKTVRQNALIVERPEPTSSEHHAPLPNELRVALTGILQAGPMRLNTLRNMLIEEGQSKTAADSLLTQIVEQGFAHSFVEAGRTHLTLDPAEAKQRHVERRGHNKNSQPIKQQHEFQPDIASQILLTLRGVLGERGSDALPAVKILETMRQHDDKGALREISKIAISGLANRLVELGLVESGELGRQGKGFGKSAKVKKYWLTELGRKFLADADPKEIAMQLADLQAQRVQD